MTAPHRIRSTVGAAALATALVLVPGAAFADDAVAPSPSPSAAPVVTDGAAPAAADQVPAEGAGTGSAPAAPAAETPATTPSADPSAVPSNTAVGTRPAPEAAPAAEAPANAAADASPRGGGTVVVQDPVVDPLVEAYPAVAHPGSSFSAWVEGFTPGDPVSARVDGPAVSKGDVFTIYPSQAPFVFDASGSTSFEVEVPADLALGTLTLTVSDAHGTTSAAEIAVAEQMAAPVLVAPTGATAGVVAVSGSGGTPGTAAVVAVGLPDDLQEGFGYGFGSTGSSARSSASVVTTAEQAADPDEEFYDVDPVEFEADQGYAVALVPVADDGTFTARFVLPEGDFGATAALVDTTTGDTSATADVVTFAVAAAAAAAPAATPASPAAAPVNTVVATRAAGSGAGLAYTGSETTAPIAVGAALLLLGAVLAVGARLRRRSRIAAAPADRS